MWAIIPKSKTILTGLKGERIVSSPTGSWTDIEQAGPTVDITEGRNKINDLQHKIDRLKFSSNLRDRKRLNTLNGMMANAMDDLATQFHNMANHITFNAKEIRKSLSGIAK